MLTVLPDTFEKVFFDVEQIQAAFADAAGRVAGLTSEFSATLTVDEDLPTARMAVVSLDPVAFRAEGGALENTRVPRTFGHDAATAHFTRLLLEYMDRTNPDFGAPPLGETIELGPRIAWDVSLFGRASALGCRVHKPKYLYNFRNRWGFTDAADAAFEALFSAGPTTWAAMQELCAPLVTD